MIAELFAQKIKEYGPANDLEYELVLKELLQLHILSSLSNMRFFDIAEFHGGTFLRIVYGITRFSEDIDFVLKKPSPLFSWEKYLNKLLMESNQSGIHLEALDKSKTDSAVKKVFLKTASSGSLLVYDFKRKDASAGKKIKIKLEIDTNPPAGSKFETKYITFPILSALTVQTLDSAFASKSHALLCRNYTKGRDWYDFLWYIARKVKPNWELLSNALIQQGPWAGKKISITPEWYLGNMTKAIESVDWESAKSDVRRFLRPFEIESVELWSKELFMSKFDEYGKTLHLN